MLFYFGFNLKGGGDICYFSRQITSGDSKKGLKAVIFMDSVISWRQTGGRELSSRASCILGCHRLCWPGWSHKCSCAIRPLSCASPTGFPCTVQQAVFWALTFYFTALTTQRDLISCLFKLLAITAETNILAEWLPLSRSDVVIPWHVDGWHHLYSTNDTGSSVLVELLHWKEVKTAPWILPQFYLPVQTLQFPYSQISLNKRLCFLQVFFLPSQHLPSSPGIQMLVALTKYFLWWMLWLHEVHLSWGPTSFADLHKVFLLGNYQLLSVSCRLSSLWIIPITIPLVPFGTYYDLTLL